MNNLFFTLLLLHIYWRQSLSVSIPFLSPNACDWSIRQIHDHDWLRVMARIQYVPAQNFQDSNILCQLFSDGNFCSNKWCFLFEVFKIFWCKHISGLLSKSLRKWISKASNLIDSVSRITQALTQNWFSHSKMRSFWSIILIFH